ncbi:MAG: GNAT family N-acetyltransferase [Dermatophilaceae bacterium]
MAYAADGTFLGVAKAGPNRPGRGAHISTASFMVSEAARGQGVGRLLGEHLLGWARESGYRAMQFNAVVETNTAAVALWRGPRFPHPCHRAGSLREPPPRPGRPASSCGASCDHLRALRSELYN